MKQELSVVISPCYRALPLSITISSVSHTVHSLITTYSHPLLWPIAVSLPLTPLCVSQFGVRLRFMTHLLS